MKFNTRVLVAIVLTTASAAALRADETLFDRSLSFLGGYDNFLKLQSVLYDFNETRSTSKGAQTLTGRHYFKFERGRCVAAQIETSSPEGEFLTILRDGGAKLWRNGEPVTEPSLVESARGEALRNAFWLAVPQALKRVGVRVEETGQTMIFEGASCRVYYASLGDASFVPGVSEVRLYLDAKTGVVRGAIYMPSDGKSAVTVAYKDYDITGDLLLATQRVETKFSKTPVRVFTLKKPKMKLGAPALMASVPAKKLKDAPTSAPPAAMDAVPAPRAAVPPAVKTAVPVLGTVSSERSPASALEFFASLSAAAREKQIASAVKPAPARAPEPAPVVRAPERDLVHTPVPAAGPDTPQTVRRARRDPAFLAMLHTPRARRMNEASTLSSVDMVNEGHRLRVVADMPGMLEQDIQIFVVERHLTIRGVRSMRPLAEGQEYVTKQRPLGSFVQEMELPFPVLSDKVEARLEKGVLTIMLPRLQTAASQIPFVR